MSTTIRRRALLSVTNKQGIEPFARGLSDLGFEILSTGGTARVLRDAGIPVTDIQAVTGFPEMLDGRVKTLHPMVHGGILAKRDVASHVEELARHGIQPIDIVAVNLYAFEEAARSEGLSDEAVIEQIDIGGPTLLRAAAKNHAHVIPLVDPRDYASILRAIERGEAILPAVRRGLAAKVFRHTAAYDAAVASFFSAGDDAGPFPERFSFELHKVQDLRYGENPHQAAAFYRHGTATTGTLPSAEQLGGKELSFNNLLDAESALALASDLGGTAAVFVKHNNPCGAAKNSVLARAVEIARACDPVSAFGAVVAVTCPVDRAAAEVLSETFLEVIIAPSFDADARDLLGRKKNLRLLAVGSLGRDRPGLDLRTVAAGALVQTRDLSRDPWREAEEARVVTKRSPTDAERAALAFGWVVAKHVRSNAIVFALGDRTVAVGAGQMSRVDSVQIARMKAGEAVRGTGVASDAFFPFRDGVDVLAAAGATAVIQPGGSVRDDEVISAADEHGLAMLITGVRHFRH